MSDNKIIHAHKDSGIFFSLVCVLLLGIFGGVCFFSPKKLTFKISPLQNLANKQKSTPLQMLISSWNQSSDLTVTQPRKMFRFV